MGIKLQNNLKKIEWIINGLIIISPIVFFSYEKIFGELYKLISLLCFFPLITNKEKLVLNQEKKIFLLIFIIFPLGIFISQLFRWDWDLHEYLDQARFLFAIPIFLYLSSITFNFSKIISYVLPATLITSYFTTKYILIDNQYGDRFTDVFLHPIYYGEISLSMSLILVSLIFLNKQDAIWLQIWKIIGALTGIIISVKTQSRTGWLNIFVIVFILLFINRNNINKFKLILFSICLVLANFAIYENNSIINTRINEAYSEIINYPWHGGVAPETSVGQRITFYRIGWYLIEKEHWYGWGYKGYRYLLDSTELLTFTTKNTIEICYKGHFHNELLTLIIRYGILGIAIYLCIFILPLYKLIKIYGETKNNHRIKVNSLIAIIFLVTQIISGFSDMVILFKYMVMYFSFFLACLLGSLYKRAN